MAARRRGREEAIAALGPSPDPVNLTVNLSSGNFLGVTLSNESRFPGVRIDEVCPPDMGARAGLQAGDVILALDDKPVSTHEEAIDAIDACKGKLAVAYYPKAAAEAEAVLVAAKYKLKPYGWPCRILTLVVSLLVGAFLVEKIVDYEGLGAKSLYNPAT